MKDILKIVFFCFCLFMGCSPNPDSYTRLPELFRKYEKQPGVVCFELPGKTKHGPLQIDSLNEVGRAIYKYRVMVFAEDSNTFRADTLLHQFEKELLYLEMQPINIQLDSISGILYLPNVNDTLINDALLFLPLNNESPTVVIIHMIGEMEKIQLLNLIEEAELSL